LNDQRLRKLARDLGAAWSNAVAIPAPTTLEESLTTEDAYSIQDLLIADRVDRGRRIAGWKLGLTSAAPPTTPIVGTLLDDMIIPTGSDLVLSSMVDPMVEAEIVIRIGATIDSAQSVESLKSGPHEIGPGLEVIDYRTVASAGVVDWIADNSTVAYAVVGEFVPISAVDPAGIEVSLSGGGRHLASGVGEVVMGNPLAAVAWLSEHLVDRGQCLQQGDVILTGSLTGHHRVSRPDLLEFSADFSGLGSVSVSFLA
jgi:2-keto-4-pentenoate hydratase